MSTRFVVQVDADQFDQLARPTQPIAGVAELIWNALDAEADLVSVTIERTHLDGVDRVLVADNGHGMTHEEALRDFKRLGGSWKKSRAGSKTGKRSLHGKQGAGRFRAFSIGAAVQWTTIANAVDGMQRTVVTGLLESSEFTVADAETLVVGQLGTEVNITRPREYVTRLLAEDAPTWLLTRFAVYLVKYPDVIITYDGQSLDPGAILEREVSVELDESLGGDHGIPVLRILEWKPEAKAISPSLVLCDANGVALAEITEGIAGDTTLPFTAYLTWDGFSEHTNELLLADMGHPTIGPVIASARELLRTHLDSRLREQRAHLIERWKQQRIYPYPEPPKSSAEEQERKVFDAVAVAASSAVPREPKAAKLSLHLIKTALGQPPGALHRVLKEVLNLTADQLADFDRLLDRTSLAGIIYTSKAVTDRLDFLNDLEAMLFDREKKERLLERQALHRILANGRTWIFGEQYALAVDDKGLTRVLEAHLKLLGHETRVAKPVTDTEGHARIVDLMLSKAALLSDRRQHLVIELKRPSIRLTQAELGQITNYAVAVRRDERFKSVDVTWEFLLLGDDMDDAVAELVNKKNQPLGLYTEGDNYRIWVRRWAEILEENRQRLHFYRDHLQFEAEDAAELESVLGKYLPTEGNA